MFTIEQHSSFFSKLNHTRFFWADAQLPSVVCSIQHSGNIFLFGVTLPSCESQAYCFLCLIWFPLMPVCGVFTSLHSFLIQPDFFFPVFFFPPTFFCILLAATACLYPESFRAIQMEHLLIQRVLSVVLSGKWKWGKAKQCFQHYFTTNENAQKKITKKKGVPLDDPEYILKDPHPSPFRVAGINKRYQNRATVCSGWRDLKVRHDNPWSISANPWAGMFSYSSHFSHT